MRAIMIIMLGGLLGIGQAGAQETADPQWVPAMREVHKNFTGTPGTLALFGDSITDSLAFWAPLEYAPKTLDRSLAEPIATVKGHMKPDCWRKWRGPDFGNQSGQTIRWADENLDRWLKKLNPEVIVLMFGTNDLRQVATADYEKTLRRVVERCLKNGSVVILTTIPPRSGMVEKAAEFAVAQRRVARDLKVPLVDYQAEILKRRPKDWDGSLPQFRDWAKEPYQVPTLIAADGIHPSAPNAHADYSEEALRSHGFQLRNVLTAKMYAQVITRVLKP